MKKILVLIAALSLLVACGGNSEKKAMTVEEKTVYYLDQLNEAEENGNMAAFEKYYVEMEEWYEGLSVEDQAKADAAAEKYMLGDLYEEDECPTENLDAEVEEDECCEEDAECCEEDEDNEGVNSDWDAVIDQYEAYVNDAVRLYKKAMAGDMDALTEYASLAEKAAALAETLEDASDMTQSQANRLAAIAMKFAESMQ